MALADRLPVTLPTPTIRDVARLAGVSHQTVSRVINNLPGTSPETRTRVEQSIRQLNYRPSRAATALATNRTNTIGIICTDGGRVGAPKALRTIERAAQEAGYYVSTVNLTAIDQQAMRSALEHLEHQKVEGLVVIAPQLEMINSVTAASPRVPVIAVEASGRSGARSVAVNNHHGALLATHHLLELGHTRIAHLAGPPDWSDAQARVEGWQEALKTAELPGAGVVNGDWSARSGAAAYPQVMAQRPTAVFCANDAMALGLLHAARRDGLTVPADLSLVGFDDIPEAEFFAPPLTTVAPDHAEVGRRCMRTLLEMMAGSEPSPDPFVDPVLVVRESAVTLD